MSSLKATVPPKRTASSSGTAKKTVTADATATSAKKKALSSSSTTAGGAKATTKKQSQQSQQQQPLLSSSLPAFRPQSPDNLAMGRLSEPSPGATARGGIGGGGGEGDVLVVGPSSSVDGTAVDASAAGGGFNDKPAASPSPMFAEGFQAFTHRRLEPSAGQRMGRTRRAKGVGVSALVAACRVGVAAQYEAMEGGTTALERWAAVLGRIAINLEVPVEYLLPLPMQRGHGNHQGGAAPLTGAAAASHFGGDADDGGPSHFASFDGGVAANATVAVGDIPQLASSASSDGDGDDLSRRSASPVPVAPNSGNQSTTATRGGGAALPAGACGQRLRAVRAERGVSADTAAQRTGLSVDEYAQVERGESAGGYEKWVWVIARFCRHLGVNPFLLVGGLPMEEASSDDDDDGEGGRRRRASSSASRSDASASVLIGNGFGSGSSFARGAGGLLMGF